MSETDDTDVLLLIPPNFFLVPSSGSEDSLLESSRTVVHKPQSCTAQVIGKLVNQVYSLENRLESLELSTASDSVSSLGPHSRLRTLQLSESFDSSDRKYSTFPRRRRRKNLTKHRKQDTSFTSLESASTYGKHIPPLKFECTESAKLQDSTVDESPSMDGDLSSIVSTPNKNNDKLLLHEIDEFLTKVDTYESPDSKLKKSESNYSPENVIKAAGDYLTQQLDAQNNYEEVTLPSGRVVPSSVLDKYIYLVKNNAISSTQVDRPAAGNNILHASDTNGIKSESNSKPCYETTKSSMESKSPSARKLTFPDTNKDVQPTSTPKRPQATTNYLDTFRPSSNKIYDRASKVLEQYKAQSMNRGNQNASANTSYALSPKKEEFKVPKRPSNVERHYNYENQRSFDPYKPIEMREGPKLGMMQSKFLDTIDTDLLSLTDLWGEKKDGGGRVDSDKLEEERLKREHCETLIQELQKKLLDQQERLAVAIKVDRSKDAAISKLKEAWLRLTTGLDRAEERHRSALDKMNREVENFKVVADESQKKTNHFEAELYKALDLAHDYQEKCKHLAKEKEQLQENMDKALACKDEVIDGKSKEIEVLKENYEAVMRLNKQSTECVKNVDEALEKEKHEHEATKNKMAELSRKLQTTQDETELVRQERDLVREKVNEERARGNILERQLADKQNLCSELMKKSDMQDSEIKSLRRQLETQKNDLKSYYQKQLEDAVLAKLQEFQVQLDSAERDLAGESRSKEDAIVHTFNKQMERIEEQHKLEINVLEEKHKEEIKLYRLQLAQASEKISLLESKLDSYRRRRGQIANELHSVMEAQWRQALRILTHASTADLTRNDTVSTPDCRDYPPPLQMSSLSQSSGREPVGRDAGGREAGGRDARAAARRDLFEGLSDNELQQYVKMLLTKPASFDASSETQKDLDSSQKDVNEEPTSDRPDKDRREKMSRRTLSLSKPPWKS
ncbi:unnamed protein product [Plutella xylostella]|uniref:(diamondback moth) hypothetical protein n=1 Tax=Plutella xylostella TaxID=51655 RepID=A0A8S4G3A2_PLUXY|nr:unnamed protein product [Plutella xylostella]